MQPTTKSITWRHLAIALVTLAIAAMPALAAANGGATPTNAADIPTYSDSVAPILNHNCVSCHRPGQIAPMSLRSYDEVRPWARSIAKKVADRSMPPWHATGGTATFANDRSLDAVDVDTIVKWAQAGAPAGDLAHAPAPPEFPETQWKLGPPDMEIALEEVSIPGGADDQFPKLVGKAGLPEDKWVKAIEILPGNARIVHHVIVVAVKGFDVDPQQGWLGAWAAGTEPMVFPEGTGRFLAKGSNLIADMHYHSTDTDQKDVTRIGLHFAKEGETPPKELSNLWIINDRFEIPAGANNYEVRASYHFWQDGQLLSFAPHMHYRGKDFKYVAHWPDGRDETLMEVGKWDFNWQTWYLLDKPIHIPAGTEIEAIAHFDNSADNPVNPDPTKTLHFGDTSYDEMMIGFVDFVADEGQRPLEPLEVRTRELKRLVAAHPGQVYAVSAKPEEKRSEPNSYAPLMLQQGAADGVFYVVWNRQLQASKIHDVSWDGSSFNGKVESPWGDFDLTGELGDQGIRAVMHLPNGRELPWDGKISGL